MPQESKAHTFRRGIESLPRKIPAYYGIEPIKPSATELKDMLSEVLRRIDKIEDRMIKNEVLNLLMVFGGRICLVC